MALSVQPHLDISRSLFLARLFDDIEAGPLNKGDDSQVPSKVLSAHVKSLSRTKVTSIEKDVVRIQKQWAQLRCQKAVNVKMSLKTNIAEFVFRSYQLTHFEEEIASKQKCPYGDYGPELLMLSASIDRLSRANISVIGQDLLSMRKRWIQLDAQFKNKCISLLSEQVKNVCSEVRATQSWDLFIKGRRIVNMCRALAVELQAIQSSEIPTNEVASFCATKKMLIALEIERKKKTAEINRAITLCVQKSAEVGRSVHVKADALLPTTEVENLYKEVCILELAPSAHFQGMLRALLTFKTVFAFKTGGPMTIAQRFGYHIEEKSFGDIDALKAAMKKTYYECAMRDFDTLAKAYDIEAAEKQYGENFKKLGIQIVKNGSGKISFKTPSKLHSFS